MRNIRDMIVITLVPLPAKMTPTLKCLTTTLTFESSEIITVPIEITDELENIREIQGRINEIITEKIDELKAENKLVEASAESESEGDEDVDEEDEE